jgi:hypothetical protein
MDARSESDRTLNFQRETPPLNALQVAAICRELESILKSPSFRTSKRCQQSLSYVVQHSLEGHVELLKERGIGAELFGRPISYATGEDGVVRVLASEVRKRLAQHYHEQASSTPVRIELPVGSYVPQFYWNPDAPPAHVEAPSRAEIRSKRWYLTMAALTLGLVLVPVLIASRVRSGRPPQSALERFWSPLFSTSQPVLICLAKPMLYRPSLDLYRRYSRTHPEAFQTEVERWSELLPLDPNEKLLWRDITAYPDFGIAAGDARVAVGLSTLFARINKPSQLRIGDNYSFEDLRNSPAVLVGAFNNRWTLQMTANLHFAFLEADSRGPARIQEQGPSGRMWFPTYAPHGRATEDFGVVTRVLDSKTGQLLIAVAGVAAAGTQAAGEFICTPAYLAEGLQTAPPDWAKKNLQVVIETTVTDWVAGPPRVVATYSW